MLQIYFGVILNFVRNALVGQQHGHAKVTRGTIWSGMSTCCQAIMSDLGSDKEYFFGDLSGDD